MKKIMLKNFFAVGKNTNKALAISVFVFGLIVMLADAWIIHVRCTVTGLVLMALAVLILVTAGSRKKSNLIRLIGIYGLIFWMIIFVATSIMIAFQIYQYQAAKIFILILSGALAYIFTKRAEPKKMIMAVFVGTGFVSIGLLLDAIVTSRFDPQIFNSTYLWVSYIFLIIGSVAGGCTCSGIKEIKSRRNNK